VKRVKLKREEKVMVEAEEVIMVIMVMEPKDSLHQHRRYQQHLKIYHYNHLQRIFCLERMLMQDKNEIERD
jgi:hypothetical protein